MLEYLEFGNGGDFVEQFAVLLGEVDNEGEAPEGEPAVLSCHLPDEDGGEGADGLEGHSRGAEGSLQQLEEAATVGQLINRAAVLARRD